MTYSRDFTPTELMALAGYQLDPGHSDLDNEQPMSVRVHDGHWDAVDLRCLLGDIRAAKRQVRGGLERDLVLSVVVGAAKALLIERDSLAKGSDVDAWAERVRKAVDDLRAAVIQAEKLRA